MRFQAVAILELQKKREGGEPFLPVEKEVVGCASSGRGRGGGGGLSVAIEEVCCALSRRGLRGGGLSTCSFSTM